MELRITSFNLENLFNRYMFLDGKNVPYETQLLPTGVVGLDRFGGATTEATTVLQRNNTARVILDTRPDILAVQEVEDLRALRSFNDTFLDGYFDRMVVIQGNDARGINVGFCVRRGCEASVVGLRTHVDELTPEAAKKGWHIDRYFNTQTSVLEAKNALFSRDCLEIDVDAGGAPLTFLVNHLKSQSGSAKESDSIRHMQAERVAALVAEVKARGRFAIVAGDLNKDWTPPDTSLQPLRKLLEAGTLKDPFAGMPDLWTHYYAPFHETSRLDYILVDARMEGAIKDVGILRKGLSLKCQQYQGERYPTIGYAETEASDHCPISVAIDTGAIKA